MLASRSTCTSAWPSVRTPAAATRSRSWALVSGPSAVSAAVTAATPRSAASGGTPSWASRRALPALTCGAVSGWSHQ